MTDKERIKLKIGKMQDALMDENSNFASAKDEGAYQALCELDFFIDSLEEESANDTDTSQEDGESNEFKKRTIEVMEELLGYAKYLPSFSVDFYISADNRYIEKYIVEHTDRTDWDGKPLSSDEIDENIRRRIRNFQNSRFYNPNGVSKLKMRKFFTLPDITFDKVYELVSNKNEDMPFGYEFAGGLELSDFMGFQ